MKKITWLAIGVPSTAPNTYDIRERESAQAATKEGRWQIDRGLWVTFRVAKVTAAYVRGAVRAE